MSTYTQSTYQPPTPGHRRTSSSSSKYVPDNYATPSHAGRGYPNPYGAPVAPPPEPLTPVRSRDSYGPAPGMALQPQNTLHPGAVANPPYPMSGTDAFTSGPPPSIHALEGRRSYESTRSRHSHDSRASRDSHRSHRNHQSYDSDRERRHRHDEGRERERRQRRENRHSSKRHKERAPTFGDTIFAVFDGLKTYLGPR